MDQSDQWIYLYNPDHNPHYQDSPWNGIFCLNKSSLFSILLYTKLVEHVAFQNQYSLLYFSPYILTDPF